VDLHVVREILGHTSVKTTERYAHVMTAPQRQALEKLGNLAPIYTEDLHQKNKRPRRAAVSR
jgi:integrase